MFKGVRRKDREIFTEDIEEILIKGEYGILATVDSNGYPYAVPVNYVYNDNSIYFHCAKDGHKIENIKLNNKVSFCIVTDTEVLSSKFSTKYKSVVAFGTASELIDDSKVKVLSNLIYKYSPDFIESGEKYIEAAKDKVRIIKISIEHMTGKAKSK